jgi:hypothetical protein
MAHEHYKSQTKSQRPFLALHLFPRFLLPPFGVSFVRVEHSGIRWRYQYSRLTGEEDGMCKRLSAFGLTVFFSFFPF